ncbi:winged helix-turn-helix transcriptional regulator [Cellulomonas palmilytica]|nr:winged helix-turn-helix transcriptional regulator [Cellulomonas palmilytica]
MDDDVAIPTRGGVWFDRFINPSGVLPTPGAPVPQSGIDRPLAEVKAELFKALSHPVRVRTLELLVEHDRQVADLLTELDLEASHLSQHLAVLRRAGVVTATRRGNAVHYTLALPAVADMLAAARAVLVDAATRRTELLEETR